VFARIFSKGLHLESGFLPVLLRHFAKS